jgi:hypothetical protein
MEQKWITGFLAICVLLMGLAGCATEASPADDNPQVVERTVGTPTVSTSIEAATATLVPKATSRGDDLEATDPKTYRKDNGRPVLIEFFRFT